MPYCPSCGREVSQDISFCPNCGFALKGQSVAPSYSSPSQSGYPDPDASTARTLTLVAIVLQSFFFMIGIFIFFIFFPFAGVAFGMPSMAFGIFGLVFGLGFLISIVWIALDYFLVYKNLESTATIARARTPSLVLGIIQLISGGTISGILLIITYVKIGDSLRRRRGAEPF